MNLWGFLVGLVLGVLPVLLLKVFKGKLLFVENAYIKGALLEFLPWIGVNVFLYLEARYDPFGLLKDDEGLSTMVVLTSSVQGFITAGLLAAFVSKKIGKSAARTRGQS
ncbi:MAG: hypothetical protein M0Z60_03625 [Nitrospiraceae bacterium]|nr:hypothetical protein [Nitrospiraceae bacterium]